MNPHIINLLIKADNERRAYEIQHQNALAHLQGKYMMEAILTTVGNMFKKKSAKPHEYPEKPFEINQKKELTEVELKKQRELFMAGLLVMKSNFEISKKNHKDGKV